MSGRVRGLSRAGLEIPPCVLFLMSMLGTAGSRGVEHQLRPLFWDLTATASWEKGQTFSLYSSS